MVNQIFKDIFMVMQEAEEIGTLKNKAEYILLMSMIIKEASMRLHAAQTYKD